MSSSKCALGVVISVPLLLSLTALVGCARLGLWTRYEINMYVELPPREGNPIVPIFYNDDFPGLPDCDFEVVGEFHVTKNLLWPYSGQKMAKMVRKRGGDALIGIDAWDVYYSDANSRESWALESWGYYVVRYLDPDCRNEIRVKPHSNGAASVTSNKRVLWVRRESSQALKEDYPDRYHDDDFSGESVGYCPMTYLGFISAQFFEFDQLDDVCQRVEGMALEMGGDCVVGRFLTRAEAKELKSQLTENSGMEYRFERAARDRERAETYGHLYWSVYSFSDSTCTSVNEKELGPWPCELQD